MNRATFLWLVFLALWALTQLFYGAMAPWAVAASAAALAALYLAARRLLPEPLKISRPALLFLAAAAAVFLLQLLPLPFLFPHAASLRRAHGVGLLWPATADTFLTVRSLAQLSAYVLAALLVLHLRQNGLRSGDVLRGAVWILFLQAAYAMVQAALELKTIPFYGPRVGASASGTLVNRNSFAGLMAMGVALAAALAFRNIHYGRRRDDSLEWNRRIESGLLWALAAALFAAGIVISHSRGGTVAALAGLAAIPFLWRGRAGAAGILLLVLAAGGALLVAHPQALFQRFGQIDPFEVTADQRVEIWRTTASAALHQPVLGYGIGTHPQAYHPFQPPTLPGQIQHAHSEYVNFLFEGGILWAGILIAGLAAWAWRVWRGMDALHGPDRIAPLAALAAAAAAAVHALVDFDLRITSIGILFGAVVAVGASKLRAGKPWRLDWIPAAVGLAAAAAMALLPLNPTPRIREVEKADAARVETVLGRTLGLSPCDHRAAWLRATAAQRRGDRAETDRRYLQAADLWPAHPDLQREAGLWFWEGYEESKDEGFRARAARCLGRLLLQRPAAAAEVMEEMWDPGRPAADYEALLPGTPEPAAYLAGFLARKGRWKEGLDLFRRACGGSAPAHDVFAAGLSAVGQWGIEVTVREERLGIKSDAWAHAAAAQAWLRLGELTKALDRASMAARIEPQGAPWHALRAEVLRARGERLQAAEAYGEAIRRAPMELAWRMARARVYVELEMHGPAAEDFREVLRSRPDDRAAVCGLARELLALGRTLEARRLLDRHLSRVPDDAEAKSLRDSIKE